MNIVFRVDASNSIGLGHLLRCLNLAEELRNRGHNITFISRSHAGNCFDLLTEKLFKLVTLPKPEASSSLGLLGVSQDEDAQQTITALQGEFPEWLIVDHYGIDVQWETKLRPHVKKILVIDDFVNRLHDCDIYLNQNYLDYSKIDFAWAEATDSQVLLGPKYALIDKEFCFTREFEKKFLNRQKRVLVFCGGSDPKDTTWKVVEALNCKEFESLQVDLVFGKNNKNLNSEKFQNLTVRFKKHEFGRNFARLLNNADFAIGAGGVTTWERMCLGVPSIVISIALNQESTCEELSKKSAITYLGRSSEITIEDLKQAIREKINDDPDNQFQVEFGQLMVDGRGSMRVAEIMSPSSVEELRIRRATVEDVYEYFTWANEPEVRKQSINHEIIELSTHLDWFRNKLKSTTSQLFVFEILGLPVGQVRFDEVGEQVRIDYSLDANVRNRGWGYLMLEKALSSFPEKRLKVFRAVVNEGNLSSCRIFEKLGFKKEFYTEGQDEWINYVGNI